MSDNTQPVGSNPISGFHVDFLGQQRSSNSASHRDLGFTGAINGKWYAVYGDVLWCDTGVTNVDDDTPGFHGMVRDAVSAVTDDPLVMVDLHLNDDKPVPHQLQLVPYHEEWGENVQTGFGGTSLCETDAASQTAVLYYLIVQVQNGTPTVVERLGSSGWWWDTDMTAKFGDIAAFRDPHSEYIYALGHPPNSESSWLAKGYVYQARVRAANAFDLSAYEYWWGRDAGWKKDVLDTFTPETAVMWGVGQGQFVYSNYFKTYFYVHIAGNKVAIKAAAKPEGPWTDAKELYEAQPIDGALVYAGVAYPHLDESGKTLAVGYTNNNRIQVVRITFD